MSTIPFFGLARQYQTLKEEILSVTNHVYSSGQVLDGVNTEMFETLMSGRCHREYAVAVNSCTQGLIFAQQAANIEGQEIIVPAISFVATLNSVAMANNYPVICDVDSAGLIDLTTLGFNTNEQKVNALMYVNLFGNVIDYDRARVITQFFGNEDFFTIEDAAQSFGASYKDIPSGKLGDISVLSFDPTKNLPNYGSGGMVLTDDWDIYINLLNLRDNGKEDNHSQPGTNSKMSESDCAQMMVKLRYFDAWQARRTDIANFYTEYLREYVRTPEVSKDVVHAWHKYPIWATGASSDLFGEIEHPYRHQLKEDLARCGVETRVHYAVPLHHHVTATGASDRFPVADEHCKTELSLPIYPELTDAEVEYVAESVLACVRSK